MYRKVGGLNIKVRLALLRASELNPSFSCMPSARLVHWTVKKQCVGDALRLVSYLFSFFARENKPT